MDEFSAEDVCGAIDAAVAGLLSAAGVTEPPVDCAELAAHLGLPVRFGSAVRPARPPDRVVTLDPAWSLEAQQAVLARAIASELRPAILRSLGLDPRERLAGGSSLTGLTAERILLPGSFYVAEAGRVEYDVELLKERFATASYESVANRLLDLDEPCVVALVVDGRATWRRSNAHRVSRHLTPAEVECDSSCRESGRAYHVRRGAWTVKGWPAPPGTGRVVLRSQVDQTES